MSSAPGVDRIRHRLERWKRQLIDLSRRNRLLNYRPTKASTVEIESPRPVDVFSPLLAGYRFHFDAKPEEEAGDEYVLPLLDGGDQSGAVEGAGPPEGGKEEGASSHTYRLQTGLTERRLPKNLLATFRRAEEALEEQGVNTLFLAFGMVTWFDSEDSDIGSKAPLVLVPVRLQRQAASTAFSLSVADEDPVLNPAFAEKLRLDFDAQLPALPEVSEEELDLAAYFHQIEDAIRPFERWKLHHDLVLGLFSFQKFVMYSDLEENEERIRRHPVIGSICRNEEESGSLSGLPPDVADPSLDEKMSPWATVQVVDADASQRRAMLAVREGYNVVIEGPPGTGKSQTITNIVSDALADGKRVLFVSEKMAALEVVKNRLEANADLGPYLLELHSNKTAKTAFVKELSGALDQTRPPAPEEPKDLQRLERLTSDLRGYVVELHRPEEPLHCSPYEAIGRLLNVAEAPTVAAPLPKLMEVDRAGLEDAQDRVRELARTLEVIGDPEVHPLRGLGIENATRSERRALDDSLEKSDRAMETLAERASALSDAVGLREAFTFADTEGMLEAARAVASSPGADPSVLRNRRWDGIPGHVEHLLALGHRFASRRGHVEKRFRPEILDLDLTGTIDTYEEGLARGVWRFFLPSYWRARGELGSYRLPGSERLDAHGLLEEARTAQACREERLEIQEAEETGAELFGSRWRGPESDWADLQDFAHWVVDFRRNIMEGFIEERGLEIAAAGGLDEAEVSGLAGDLSQAIHEARTALAEATHAGRCGEEAGIHATSSAEIDSISQRIREMREGLDGLRAYSQYVAARNACRDHAEEPFVAAALDAKVEPASLHDAFLRRFFEDWVEQVVSDRPVLAEFDTGKQQDRIERFQELDRKSRELAKARTHGALQERRQQLLASQLRGQLDLLQRQARKSRGIMSIRNLMSRAGEAIQEIKPCFLMSPLSVAQYLDPDEVEFDLLVFDEASQIPPPDAIGSIFRAKQTVVVGDSKQLPPTTFFSGHLEGEDVTEEEEVEALDDLESILDEVAVAGVPSVRLKWHYRSKHESLIRFSNEEFYQDDPLVVFPSAELESQDAGLKLEFIDEGVYEGNGRNPMEARRVVDAVVDHIRNRGHLSLGIGTFGIAQQSLILDELDERRRRDPSIEWFFEAEGEEKFFVKNLENVQGDNRDVIFLSVTYGPDRDGRVKRNFGPINKDGGWRRLNVLTTRAKQLLVVFSSMHDEHIPSDNVSRGAVLLRQYLGYARTGNYPSPKIPGGEAESPFETAVLQALRERGHTVVSQVGEAGYRVDIGVVDPALPGRFLCGIECDGASYHHAETVRDRDRLREEVLRSRGWDIHRVWSTDWFHDPRGQLERLDRLIEESKRRAEGHQDRPASHGDGAGGATAGGTGILDSPRGSPLDKGDGQANSDALEPRSPGEELDGRNDGEAPASSLPDPPPYQFAPIQRKGDPAQFYRASPKAIADAARAVLKVEAPIHVKELSRRVAGCWNLSQVGTRVIEKVEAGLRRLTREKQATWDGDFLTLPGMKRSPVRSRNLDGVVFHAEQIPPEELREAVRVVLRHDNPVVAEDLVVRTARLLGFQRTGKNLRAVIEEAVERLVEDGEVRPGGKGLFLSE